MTLALLEFAPLDWAVTGAFVMAILVLGFSARVRDSSVVQYLAAGRSLSLPAFVATLVCTWYGGILGVGESVSLYGFGTWLLLGVPYYIFALIYAVFFAKRVRGGEQISIPERLHDRWGREVGILAGILIFLLAVPAAHVLMLAVLVQQFTGWSLNAGLIISTVLGLALLYRGGLLADVRMSLLAFAMMYVGFATIDLYCLTHFPVAQAFAVIPDKSLLTFTGGSGWTVILSFLILGSWTLVDPGFHQRVASARSQQTGQRGVFVSVGFWIVFDLLSMTTGMYALSLLHPLPENKLAIFPELGNQVLPSGLKAIFVCGMLGTITSALVGYTLVSGATVGREIVARIKREPDHGLTTVWVKAGLVLALVIAAILARSVKSVVDLWYAWAGAVVGSMLLPVCIAYLSSKASRITPRVVFASMAIAAASSIGWLVYGLRTNNPFGEVDWVKVQGSWRMVLPPIPADFKNNEIASFSVGTLLPGLVISALVLAIGHLGTKRIGNQ